ncbi:MAG: hypothetical protein methR_P1804 [Methyloprofundus sp.]|nr:MAG: hypothetical protein methR_P1804 [Methyloprofundus sp.]
MDLMQLGAQLIQSKLGSNVSESGISDALGALLGGSSSGGATAGGIDLGSIVSNMITQGGGLESIIGSWLGDGSNEAISAGQIKDILGGDKVAAFANQLGVDENTAADSLAEAVPQMVDKGSTGGSLLDAVGGIDGALNLAKKFFG